MLPRGVFVPTLLWVKISFDPAKRLKTLADRGLDFARAAEAFADSVAEMEDTRQNYQERRFVTAGMLDSRMVVIVWTPRDGTRRVISMRHAHEREELFWQQLIG
jgi:uncharacterized DUF497 family protein